MLSLGVRVIYGQTARVTVFLIEVEVVLNCFIILWKFVIQMCLY
jgi:hypothetical protein